MRVNAHPSSGAGRQADELRDVLERFDVGVVVRRMEAGFAELPAYTRFAWPADRGAVAARLGFDLAGPYCPFAARLAGPEILGGFWAAARRDSGAGDLPSGGRGWRA
jgi:hypothetical protein